MLWQFNVLFPEEIYLWAINVQCHGGAAQPFFLSYISIPPRTSSIIINSIYTIILHVSVVLNSNVNIFPCLSTNEMQWLTVHNPLKLNYHHISCQVYFGVNQNTCLAWSKQHKFLVNRRGKTRTGNTCYFFQSSR